MTHITYQQEPNLAVEEFLDVLNRSTLASRRPVGELATLQGMLNHADVITTARADDKLVGISRAITDYSYCTYLSDLAVVTDFQRHGIGKELVHHTHKAAGLNTTLILLSAPQVGSNYPHIGMQPHHSCWTIARQVDPPSRRADAAGTE